MARSHPLSTATAPLAGSVDLSELTSWVAAQVAPYKRLAKIRLVEAIPRTPSGKLLRHVLRDAAPSHA